MGWGSGAEARCAVVREPPAACYEAAFLALAVAFGTTAGWIGEEEGKNDGEDEEEEVVVVLRDAGSAALRNWPALRALAASAGATAGWMEAIMSGCRLVAGGCSHPVAIQWGGGVTRLAAVCWGGLGQRSPPAGLGFTGLL